MTVKIIAFYHIKGGVGKTATAVNISYLASRGHRPSLLCDLDPQGSTSFYLRIRPKKKFSSKKLLKGGKRIDKNIRGTDYENLDLLPADFSFRNMDILLSQLKRSKKHLRRVLKPLLREYEYIFLDCPPGITLVSENIFRAADLILVPVIPTTLSILTFEKLSHFFERKKLDQSKLLAFFSMVDTRKKLVQETLETLQNKPYFLKSQIPLLADVEKMGIYREPIHRFAKESPAATAYKYLWQEIKSRLDQSKH
jgi:cellulose biosynthesis protein BcsQ